MKSMSKRRVAGQDGVVLEMLSASEEFDVEKITRLANRIYEDCFPPEMCKSVIITVQMSEITKCEQYRTTSLVSHLAKSVL